MNLLENLDGSTSFKLLFCRISSQHQEVLYNDKALIYKKIMVINNQISNYYNIASQKTEIQKPKAKESLSYEIGDRVNVNVNDNEG